MPNYDLFFRFGAALVIGILIGLQREYAYGEPFREMFAGARTFALIGVFGCAAALIADLMDSAWVFVGLCLLLGGMVGIAYFIGAWQRSEVGMTTEVAALVTVMIGALCYMEYLELAAAVGVATTVLLALKLEVRTFVRQITREDVYATLRFAVITAIILPVFPNQGFGPPPLDVINPYQVWLMVVLITGISFLGYVLVKILGARQGVVLSGLLGGFVSSTAVSMSFSQRSQRKLDLSKTFAIAIIMAWTMMFPRVLIEVAVLNQALLRVLWPPIVAAGLVGLLYSIYLFFTQHLSEKGDIELSNPFELWPAIKFGIFYAIVLLVSKAAVTYLGDTGVYLSSIFAGLADVDAITLSMAELSKGPSGLDLMLAQRAIVLAVMANTFVKGGIVFFIGSRSLSKTLLPAFLLIVIVGIGVAFGI